MPASERSQDSCNQKIDSRIQTIPRGCKIIYLTILLLSLITFIVCMGLTIAYPPYGSATSVHGAAIKARIPDITTVVYATVTAAATRLLTPAPTHTSIVVQRGFSSDVVAWICVAAICGVLLIVILLYCVVRCLLGRTDRMNGAGDHRAGHCCGEDHSVRGTASVIENVGAGYSLRDLSGGDQAAGDRVAGEEAVGSHARRDSFAGDQPTGRYPLEKRI